LRQAGETLIIPLVDEILVAKKRLILKEELRVRMQRTLVREPKIQTLRRKEAVLERVSTQEVNSIDIDGTKRA
jgi:hypothetical protein